MSQPFQWIVIVLIVLTFINSFFSIYTEVSFFDIVDNIFMGLYCLEIGIKIIGLGPEDFFLDKWNKVDFFLVAIGLTF